MMDERTRADRVGSPRRWITPLALLAILGLAVLLRYTGLDWDAGEHLHPDERFLTMVASALHRPQDLLGYMDTDTSPLNPRNMGHAFYVYGTWPMTLVRLLAEWAGATDFYTVYMVGRQLSALYDSLAVLLVFGIGWRLYDRRVGLLAAGLAAVTTFNIQQAHFFTADVPANFFFLLFLFFALGMVRRDSWPDTLGAGLAMGMALASKISLWPMAPVAMIALAAEAWQRGNDRRAWLGWTQRVAVLGLVSFATLRVCQPDMFAGPGWPNVEADPARFAEVTAGAVPDWWFTLEASMPAPLKPQLLPDPRWAENMSRISGQVQGYGMDWPPNHQWWGRKDWWFPWKNMVLWGMGLPLGLLAWAGWLLAGWQLLWRRRLVHLLPWVWTTWVFAFYGAQWGKTMRYFLPIYPTLTLMGAFLLVALWDRSRRRGESAHELDQGPWEPGESAAVAGGATASISAPLRVPGPSAGSVSVPEAESDSMSDTVSDAMPEPTSEAPPEAVPDPVPDAVPDATRNAARTPAPSPESKARSVSRLGLPELPLDLPRWLTPLARPALVTALGLVVVTGTLLYGLAFTRIYTRDHSRIAASRWIYHNIPTAFGLTTVGTEPYPWGAMRLLPARPASELAFEEGSYRYTLEPDRWIGPADVLVPGGRAIDVDGVQLAHLIDAESGAGPVTLHAIVSQSDRLDAAGEPEAVLASGELQVDLGREDQDLVVPLSGARLEPMFEAPPPPRGLAAKLRELVGRPYVPPVGDSPRYALWLKVEGAPISGRTNVFADQTSWDDTVPRGVDGYGPWDQADTSWPEGMYGFVQIDLYHEDRDPAKLGWTIDGLAKSDYTIATSNRVYGAIRQLPTRYPASIELYDLMFGEQLGFEHTASIHSFPGLGPFEIDDQPAEEAFHVYDHPQVDIWRVDGVDLEALRSTLLPLTGPEAVTWQWPSDTRSLADRYVWPILGWIPGLSERRAAALQALGSAPEPEQAETPPPPEVLLLSAERRSAERDRADYVFDPEGWSTRWPALAALIWYLLLSALGLAAFPLLWTWLPNLSDRGWSLARIAGLLAVSWLAWLAASLGLVDHKPPLLWAAVSVLVALSLLALRGGRRAELRAWLAASRGMIVRQELLFLVLFLIFLGIRVGNPDLWHPYYGGEKPMDFAYLNATLRSVAFPPYDPWFAGGKLNYYYFGFVFVGALMELSRIVPWVAYNLAIPSLAAMTGLGLAGLVQSWLRASRVRASVAESSGALAAVLAVLSGNLFQVRFIAENLAGVSPIAFESRIPGLALTVRALAALPGWLGGKLALNIQTGHWYWNASRAIPAQGEVGPITEMPFFTFVYADLHAHMMALPLTVLSLGVALSWALDSRGEAQGYWWLEPWRLGRLGLGALAVGALWPANTWDFPTYGLVAAGAIAAAEWRRLGGPGLRWVLHVGLRGGLLLGLSLLLFQPYHAAYVTPYADFKLWQSVKTPPDAYLIVHGIFLFAILTWVLASLDDGLDDPEERMPLLRRLLVVVPLVGLTLWWLWGKTTSGFTPGMEFAPSPWTPVLAGAVLVLGLVLLLRPRLDAGERFAAWLVVLGAFLGLFVEFVVLAGDIGRMNTVFKFYIQIWILWAALAAFAAGWLVERWRRRPDGGGVASLAWRAGFGLLLACGLVYTVTAAKAKIADRFHPAYGMPESVRENYEANYRPGLSGIAYMDYAYYAEGDRALALGRDWPAMRWLLENVKGSPTILEAYNFNGGYRWGSRYSIYTGLPTVIGWDWHQKQQRNAVGGWVVDERTRDVGEIYNTIGEDTARALLDKYAVEYLIVGELERALYKPEGLAKFERWAAAGSIEPVFVSEDREPDGRPAVTIYRLDRDGQEVEAP
ncbi:MAG: glycosyltransferase family 39 protein [Chloroflexi bacterium]|nr:glycosyltransferase family 39 protein [Chloroflexota bacterium]